MSNAHAKARGWLNAEERQIHPTDICVPELLDAYAAHVLRELADSAYVKVNGIEQDSKPLADWLRAEAERLERGTS